MFKATRGCTAGQGRAGQSGTVLRGIRSRTWRAESRAEEGRIKERRGQRRAQSAISLFV